MSGNIADEEWVAKMKALSAAEQADLLAAAVRLVQHPAASSTPLESEARVLAEQIYTALGSSLVS